MENREQEWFKKRIGVITASEVDKLFSASGKWIDGNITYLYQKQYERAFNEPLCPKSARSLTLGTENEPYAIAWMRDKHPDWIIKHCSVDYDEIVFVKNDWGLGGSPDGFIFINEEKESPDKLLETKCVVGDKQICRYFSPTLPYDKKRIEAFEEHKYQLYAQFILFPSVNEIILLKYRPQFDDNPFDLLPVLDESRGIEFVFTREEMGVMLQVVEDRVRFADEYLKSGKDLELLSAKSLDVFKEIAKIAKPKNV